MNLRGNCSRRCWGAQASLLEADFKQLYEDPTLAEEVFGPTTLLIHMETEADMLQAARSLEGHLTATILCTEQDLTEHQELLRYPEGLLRLWRGAWTGPR